MEDNVKLLPKEILSQVLTNTNMYDIVNYCLTSKESLQICDNKYLLDILTDKYLPVDDYSKYSGRDIITLVKYNLMYVLTFQAYVNNNPNNKLANDFYTSTGYKKGLINTYILPILYDDNYGNFDKYNNELDWLMYMNIENLVKLCSTVYPGSTFIPDKKLLNSTDRIFQIGKSDKEITEFLKTYFKWLSVYRYIDEISDLLRNCVSYNKLHIFNELIVDIYPQIDKDSKIYEFHKYYSLKKDQYGRINTDDAVNIFLSSSTDRTYVSNYLTNHGRITDKIQEALENIDFLRDIFKMSENISKLFAHIGSYVTRKFQQSYNGYINDDIFNIKPTSEQYMKFIFYIMNPMTDKNLIMKRITGDMKLYINSILRTKEYDLIRDLVLKFGQDNIYKNIVDLWNVTPNIGFVMKVIDESIGLLTKPLHNFYNELYSSKGGIVSSTYINILILLLYIKEEGKSVLTSIIR